MNKAEACAVTERIDGLATAYIEGNECKELAENIALVRDEKFVKDCLKLIFTRGYQRGLGDGFRHAINVLTNGEQK